ncbi:MAG: tetratricopeptide repeat protein [Desulfomonilaceae bacterium]
MAKTILRSVYDLMDIPAGLQILSGGCQSCNTAALNRSVAAVLVFLAVAALLFVPADAMSFDQESIVRQRNLERASDYMELGRDNLLRGDYLRAIRLLTVSIRGNPAPEAFKLRGQAYDLLGNYEKAISDLSEYISATPTDPSGYLLRADAYTFHGKAQKGIGDYSYSIRLNPSSIDAYLGRGIAYVATERYEEGIRDFKKVLSKDPKNSDALYDIAVACMLAKRPAESLSFLQKVVGPESDPKSKQKLETLTARVKEEIRTSKPTQGGHIFSEKDLLSESEPPATKPVPPVAAIPPVKPSEPLENITGYWETTYMGNRIKLDISQHEGKIIRGVFRITNPLGKEDTYHFTGTFENGQIQASHYSGQSFRGRLDSNGRVTGVLRTSNGQEVPVDFGLAKR